MSDEFLTRSQYLTSQFKRSVDILFSMFGILVTVLLFVPVAVAIKLSSRGSIFYRQSRLGLNGKPFIVLKFRTMVANAESKSGAVWAEKNDARITLIGKFLRRSYIDEFPQWWNVLRGDMSVVGPRPERPEIAAGVQDIYPKFDARLKAKPGITGLAQVHYPYASSMIDSKRKLSFDTIYVSKASIALDFKIILLTLESMVRRRGR